MSFLPPHGGSGHRAASLTTAFRFHPTRAHLAVLLALSPLTILAQETVADPAAIIVTAPKPAPIGIKLGAPALAPMRSATSDTASLLKNVPGLSLYGAGGVSSLPALHGMADDRVRVKVNGMDLISACANHMNPPLSYIDPSQVGSVSVFAGIAPVSQGGDSIGGTISVTSSAPEFAAPSKGLLLKGLVGLSYRSNGNAHSANVAATAASETVSLSYSGAASGAGNTQAASGFKPNGLAASDRASIGGESIGSTHYRNENHALTLAHQRDNHLIELKLGWQDIPHQGFPNQRMDMTGNASTQFNLSYSGHFGWGALDARLYDEKTRHRMNFGDDKQFWYTGAPGMPMDTEGKNTGLALKANIGVSERDLLRVGGEYQRYRMNDWWSPSGTGAMMAPNTFWNINNGQRDRFDLFGEWEARWSEQWLSSLGARHGRVAMNTGTVQGYSTAMYAPATYAAFNAANRVRTDNNLDLTALARYTPESHQTVEFGYARKVRSPNLYERYTWSTNNTMVMNMNNWFGDGHGYVGNIDLKPEVAHTLSVTSQWRGTGQDAWEFKATPYYTRVQGYIDAVTCSEVGKSCPARTDGFLNLSLANQTARLYGVDVAGRLPLDEAGKLKLSGVLNYVRGKNLNSGDNLYNLMPINATLAVEQRSGGWTHALETRLVGAKRQVQAMRKELPTGGYALFNLRTSYDWDTLRLDAGIENLFDKYHANPMGGVYIGQGATMGTGVVPGTPVPGAGRSVYAGATVKF